MKNDWTKLAKDWSLRPGETKRQRVERLFPTKNPSKKDLDKADKVPGTSLEAE